jgi:hypothetical protein
MDAVTYPDERVARFLNENTVPYKPELAEHRQLAESYGVQWTPGLAWLDQDAQLRHQNVGYFAPEEFLAEQEMGLGQVAMGQHDWKAASKHFNEVQDSFPGSAAAPAALYWNGVASKLAADDAGPLMENWKKLLEEHGDSPWAMKVEFIREG